MLLYESEALINAETRTMGVSPTVNEADTPDYRARFGIFNALMLLEAPVNKALAAIHKSISSTIDQGHQILIAILLFIFQCS